jgi:hypothetical protein
MAKYDLLKTIFMRSTELNNETKNSIINIINENTEADEEYVIGLIQECIISYVQNT